MDLLVMSDSLKKETTEIQEQITNLKVTNNEENNFCVNLAKMAKVCMKKISEEFDPGVDQSYKHYKHLYNQRDKFLQPFKIGEKKCKSLSSGFFADQEAIRKKEQASIDEKSRKADDKRKSDLEQQKQGWIKKGDEKKAEAERHKETGHRFLAEKTMEEANKYYEKAGHRQEQKEEVHTPAPIVETQAEKQSGLSHRDNWKAEVVDEATFYKAVLMGNIPRSCIEPNQSRINSYAKDVKETKTENGLRFYNEIVSSLRV